MSNPNAFLTWFLQNTGGVLVVGFALALLLCPLVTRSAVIRSRCEIVLSAIIAALCVSRPVFSDMPRGYALPFAAASAFGVAFTIAWLRFSGARSGFGWLCLAFHSLVLISIIQEL